MPLLLLIDADPAHAAMLERRLTRKGLRAQLAADPQQAALLTGTLLPDLLLVSLPADAAAASRLLQPLREAARPARIPLLGLCADISLVVDCDACLSLPVDFTALLATIDSLLHAPGATA